MLKHSRQPLQSAEAAPWSLLLPWRCRLSGAPVLGPCCWQWTWAVETASAWLTCPLPLTGAAERQLAVGGDTWGKFKVQINNDLQVLLTISAAESTQLWSELSVHHKIRVLIPEFTSNMTVWLSVRFLYMKTKPNRSMATITSKP